MIAEVVFHFPGPWPDYYDYSTKHAVAPHSAGESLTFFGHIWGDEPGRTAHAVAALVIAGLALVARS